MRIAQISPLCESIPPRRYGGTERVVHYLTEELVRRGHGVVLFASGDSHTSAELFPCVPKALRLAGYSGDPTVPELIQLDQLIEQIDRFDVLHFHTGASHYPLARRLPVPHLNTLHGPLTTPDQAQLFRRFHQLPLVSISEAQRQPLPEAHWLDTIHHGLPLDLYQPVGTPQEYLAFVGRIAPEKRLDRAIAIASQLGLPLKVAAKIDSSDQDYYRNRVAPLIEGNPLVEFVGEVDDAGKQELLGNALALLFPIDWAEPFGLVMIEANACGTPVIAWRNGSTPEIIRPGLNGVLVDTIAEAVAAVRRLERLDRQAVRRDFESRFSVTRQASQYERLYQHLAETHGSPGSQRSLHRPCPPRDPLLHAA
ncbi:MAG: glycosyltransferase family 4 protein [Cyanobium sp.]